MQHNKKKYSVWHVTSDDLIGEIIMWCEMGLIDKVDQEIVDPELKPDEKKELNDLIDELNAELAKITFDGPGTVNDVPIFITGTGENNKFEYAITRT